MCNSSLNPYIKAQEKYFEISLFLILKILSHDFGRNVISTDSTKNKIKEHQLHQLIHFKRKDKQCYFGSLNKDILDSIMHELFI